MREVATEYGQYLAAWGVRPGSSYSFASFVEPAQLTTVDKKGADYFSSIFNGVATQDLNMLLSAFHVMLSFNERVLALDTSNEARSTTFKIRFLFAYQMRHGLTQIARERSADLTRRSERAINDLLTLPESSLFESRGFRNDLMHYCPDAKIADHVLGKDYDTLYRLPEFYYDGAGLDVLCQRLETWTPGALTLMQEWEG
jgi:hypothetical protein